MNARMTRRALLGTTLSALATRAMAQGFAGLGTASDGFARPTPGKTFRFPEDHGPHPDYRIEWWYITANLEGPDGTPYGVQWTLFRSALAPSGGDDGWAGRQAWMGHAGLTTPDAHFAAERLGRGGTGQAGVSVEPFEAFIDDWSLAGPTLGNVTMRAAGADFAYDLQLDADGPFVFQGDDGYSVKSAAGQASYYYSQPFYRVSGRLMLPGGEVEVTGRAWLDREWSSQPLSEDQSGWDWFSLHFDSGDKMMGFRLRGAEEFTAATWITADGQTTPFPDGAFAAEPLETTDVAGREVPTRWAVRLPDRGVDITVAAINPDAFMDLGFGYWEGPVTVTGSHGGIGYLEMTGYG